ncbi:G1 S-specific cyclin pas1 [Paramyrothecium foliicola]|nr:G1 S-specific cyclin pas1 [Paramyrothecium foliicola]
MKCDAPISPAASISSTRYAPYTTSSLTSSATTSAASVWSDASSQSSDDSSISAHSSDSESCEPRYIPRNKVNIDPFRNVRPVAYQQPKTDVLPAELRQNPRRTASGPHSKATCPPTLVRQSDRKVNFVDSLVDSSTQIVEAIWPLSSAVCRSELGSKAVLPLRTFIQETLRRSRTSYSTLQVALYYLILIKPHVPKHDFTMEQPDDRQSCRALQCGRRMFLAALILASKYLQDRNYSARAWSKISGLNTHEINQNEIAFLLSVNWKLHIADDVFQRWTEIVLKYTPPPSPPSPGGVSQTYTQAAADWKRIILQLNPELTNVDGLLPIPQPTKPSDLSVTSPRSILNMPQESAGEAAEVTPTPKAYSTPIIMEPTPTTVYTPGRLAPALGMLPTPRLTPQPSGFCTPAATAASQILGKSGSMGLAMAQANNVAATSYLDRLPMSVTSSPQSYLCTRRSSLANSVSTTSSPESLISDSSRLSRSSSISSISSLASATLNSSKLSVTSRFRAAKLCSERLSSRPTFSSVPEDYVDEQCFTSSPESYYTGPVGKLGDMCLDTPLAKFDTLAQDPASDAARALQDLHNHDTSADATPTPRTGSKRSRPLSMENPLQENVRDMLHGRYATQSAWPNTLIRTRGVVSESYLQVPARSDLSGARKRVCCSTEAANGYETSSVHPAISLRGPGMWEGILN